MTKSEKVNSLNSSQPKLETVESIHRLQKAIEQLDLSKIGTEALAAIDSIKRELNNTLAELETNTAKTTAAIANTYGEILAEKITPVSLSLSTLIDQAQQKGQALHRLQQLATPKGLAKLSERQVRVEKMQYVILGFLGLQLIGAMFLILAR